MPFFKTTKNIFSTPWEDELHNDNWFDSPFLQLPPSVPWKYDRRMEIDDVDIWEQIYYETGNKGLYAAWSPYAEFYMITHHEDDIKKYGVSIETFYGKMAGMRAYKRARELGMPVRIKKVWVDNEDMWLYTKED